MLRIIAGDLTDPRVAALLLHHLVTARAETGEGSAHALDLSGLKAPDITLWTGWNGESLVAVGALRTLEAEHGEVKSMHVAASARRQGFGGQMLDHIVATAKARGMRRISLETGSWPYFAPSRAMYRRHGFIECQPFGDYKPDPNSVFMTRQLAEA
jgi:putative acetyltransferase